MRAGPTGPAAVGRGASWLLLAAMAAWSSRSCSPNSACPTRSRRRDRSRTRSARCATAPPHRGQGATTYPTDGELNFTTVRVGGGRAMRRRSSTTCPRNCPATRRSCPSMRSSPGAPPRGDPEENQAEMVGSQQEAAAVAARSRVCGARDGLDRFGVRVLGLRRPAARGMSSPASGCRHRRRRRDPGRGGQGGTRWPDLGHRRTRWRETTVEARPSTWRVAPSSASSCTARVRLRRQGHHHRRGRRRAVGRMMFALGSTTCSPRAPSPAGTRSPAPAPSTPTARSAPSAGRPEGHRRQGGRDELLPRPARQLRRTRRTGPGRHGGVLHRDVHRRARGGRGHRRRRHR